MSEGAGSPRTRGDWILGLALLVAFSPGLVDLAHHFWHDAWPRYGLCFALLLVWCVHHSPRVQPRPQLGIALVGVSLIVQFLAALAAALPVSRPALAGAGIGFLLMRGMAPLRTLLLALFIVPIPYSVTQLLGGLAVADFLLESSARLVSALGFPLRVGDLDVSAGSAALVAAPFHGGLPLLQVMLGLAWYASLRRGLGAFDTARSIVRHVAMGALILGVAPVLACFALALGSAWVAEGILDSLVWLVPTAVVVFRTERALESVAGGSA